MTAVAAKQTTEAQKSLEAAEKAVADLDTQLAAAAEDKKEPIAAKKQQAEAKRDAQRRAACPRTRSPSPAALAEIDGWYQARACQGAGDVRHRRSPTSS